MSLPLLDALLAQGESICHALEAGDLDGIGSLTAERQRLVDQLTAQPPPTPLPTAWVTFGPAFTAQNRRIAALTAAQDRAFTEALGQATQHRRAHTSYAAPTHAASRLQAVHG